MPHWNQEINHLARKEFANSPFKKIASLMLNSLYHCHPQQSPYGQGTVEKSSSVDIRTTSSYDACYIPHSHLLSAIQGNKYTQLLFGGYRGNFWPKQSLNVCVCMKSENIILAGVCIYILISYIYLSQIDKGPFWHLLLLECKSSHHVGMLIAER